MFLLIYKINVLGKLLGSTLFVYVCVLLSFFLSFFGRILCYVFLSFSLHVAFAGS